ncbi:DNA cytosine methyltransferase [Fibrobacter sp. UWH1]|uniref:DNA cytosine methyltransferase n=1 Tax=Fibrobacter sp. UWH1 TaxID=1964354 RepID=UPI000B52331D|nr:DNA cytosine methyltransferase [Fibrobacter sp. UWH1]OWV14727.1 DNA (cytosine-5-)-methyltransferase [Fibrobacter sp. UWH1]
MKFLDLFAGAGGLSEGFVREGFKPIAHVELWDAASYTLKTRAAFHYLEDFGQREIYAQYLRGEISRDDLYSHVPQNVLDSVINKEIGEDTIASIFEKIDALKGDEDIDLVVGGPPCQAYSLVGRARDPNGMKDDKRNYLFQYYAQFLERYQPKYFVFENVLGLLSAKDENGALYFDLMQQKFREIGYRVDYRVLSADNYGVLQKRKRIILIGKKTEEDFQYPEPEPVEHPYTVKAVFSGLASLHAGEGDVYGHPLTAGRHSQWLEEFGVLSTYPVTFHYARPNCDRDLEIYRRVVDLWNHERKRLDYSQLPEELKTHANQKTFLDRFKVVAETESASQTIVAHICKDGHYYIHPDIEQNRSITPREAARLQTFPDDYFFESASGKPSRTDAFKQIGNAVPVLLAQKIAAKLREVWDD